MAVIADFVSDWQVAIALGLVGLLMLLFVLELYPPEVPAAGVAALFVALGYVDGKEMLGVFSNSAPLTVAAMFVLSGALVRTGVLEAVSDAVIARSASHPRRALVLMVLVTLLASAFVNNTPVVLVLIPVVIRLAGALGVASTRLLIPLSYVAILGGTCTLIGTSTNLVVDGVAQEQGLEAFSIFEITPVGLVVAATGMAYLLLAGRFFLPSRPDSDPEDLMGESVYITEVAVLDNGLVGKPLGQVPALNRTGMKVTGLKRRGETRRTGLAEEVLEAGDRLIVTATTSELLTLHEETGLQVGLRRGDRYEGEVARVEVVVAPQKAHAGRSLREMSLGRRYGVRVLGAHRHGHIAGPDLGSVQLRAADKLLLEGPPEAFSTLEEEAQLVSVSRPVGRAFRRGRAPLSLIALAGVVGFAAFGLADIATLSMIAVAAMLILRCIDADEAWGALDGAILVLIFAMLIIGIGLQNTGAVEAIVGLVSPVLATMPPVIALALVYLLSSVLTELVTNNAVAVLLTPIAIGLAASLGVDARAMVIIVMFGASASFATPIGYQTNTLVYGAGNYRFADFLKVGVPMNIVAGLATVLAVWVLYL
ncbi:SLC13 family permease [Vannielia litorea]|uniref:TrkA-C domain-containing protein n=1 Tax=Vannielia litorea TaxID=1217970 RepID=A0A1N6GPF0_9RHOB|nr:SLC13 family permease [Vannielia litorea]SIO09429.1 TrkA-C domain-containing protein [Vannielia litorea]